MVSTFSGCLQNGNSNYFADIINNHITPHVQVVHSQLDKIKIGCSENDVMHLIGPPSDSNITRTATAKSEQLIYTGEQLVRYIQGYDAWSDYSTYLTSYVKDFSVSLYFENGVLTSTQGF